VTAVGTFPSAAEIEARLRGTLQPSDLQVQDDSAAHAGHAGAASGSHFTVRLTSERFTGLSRLARHRLVYDALSDLMARGIHALAIEARSPADR
jgi:BolA family transcriptional regulator, general stress-responsive regulator